MFIFYSIHSSITDATFLSFIFRYKKKAKYAISIFRFLSLRQDLRHEVTSAGFKPTTLGTGILRSIQLNYEAQKVDANVRKKLETCKQRKEAIKIKVEDRICRV